jgi:glycosyltransferase involved in cell wall biosynthesis
MAEWRDMRHNQAMTEGLLCELKKPCELVWERSSRLHFAGINVAKKLQVPYVLEWKDHLIPYGHSLFHRRAWRIERIKGRTAATVVVESGVLRDRLAETTGSEAGIVVAHNAVDAQQFYRSEAGRTEFRRLIHASEEDVVIGYMGSYAFYHDCKTFVLAAKAALQQGRRSLKFVMIGSGQEYQETAALARKERLDTNLMMLPPVPLAQAPAVLSGFDVAVLPGSTDIICPIKIAEFMASEIPAVAPDYRCNREVIQDGETGVLFAPKQPEALADKLVLLADRPSWRRELGQRARQEAIERFSWEATWGKALRQIVELP